MLKQAYHVMIITDQLMPEGKGSGKEHIGETLVNAHLLIGYRASVFAVGTAGIGSYVDGELLKSFCKERALQSIDRDTGYRSLKIHWFLLRQLFPSGKTLVSLLSDIKHHLAYARALADIGRYIKESGKPDFLTVTVWRHSSTAQMVRHASSFYGIPMIFWEHRTAYQRGKKILRHSDNPEWYCVLNQATRVLAVSELLVARIKNAFPMVETAKFGVMPNPVRENFFGPSGKSSEEVKAFSAGRFVFAGWENWTRDMKRVDVLLDAFQEVIALHKHVCLVLVGSLPESAVKRIIDNRLDSFILMMGKVHHDRIKPIVKPIDCCVISSDHETFGNPAVEALAMGKPVITTKCGGPESIIKHRLLGRVVEPANPGAFAEAMVDVLNNKGTFDSHWITEYCRERYSTDAFAQLWKKCYENID